jgi:hypothetical protein
VNLVIRSLLDDEFEILFASLKPLFAAPISLDASIATQPEGQPEGEERKVAFASLLPGITRSSHLVLNGNEYLERGEENVGLRALSAMIYAGF